MWDCTSTRPGAPGALPALLVAVILLWPSTAAAQAERGQRVLGQPLAEAVDTATAAKDGVRVPPDVGVAPGAEDLAPFPAWAERSLRGLERRLAADIAVDDVGSIAGAVVVGDSVIWQAGLGLADRTTGALAGPTTLYRAGSIGKSVTALALLALVDRGSMALDDPAEDVIPELRHLANRAAGHRAITFRDLASHTAGLAREPAVSHAARGSYHDWRQKLVDAIAATEVVTAPGEAYLYSNVGYALLGLALERVAGKPYDVLVRTLVLDPLGMESSHLILPASERGRLATGYVNVSGDSVDPRVPRAEHLGRGYQVPAAGLYSTVGDLARLAMAMTGALGDVPVTDSLRAAALTDQTPSAAIHAGAALAGIESPHAVDAVGYGLGFQLHRIGDTVLGGHSGTIAGYSAYLAFDPESRVAVVLLRNYNHGTTNLGATAARLVLELAAARRDGEGLEHR